MIGSLDSIAPKEVVPRVRAVYIQFRTEYKHPNGAPVITAGRNGGIEFQLIKGQCSGGLALIYSD